MDMDGFVCQCDIVAVPQKILGYIDQGIVGALDIFRDDRV